MGADKNRGTVFKLVIVSIAMFGFGYALVPLYDVFCEVTGLNGKTGEMSAAEAGQLGVDADRLVTVEFDTNVNSQLPWDFSIKQRTMKVHPGEVYEAVFVARNLTSREIAGQAVPSVAPAKASIYFSKTECFCFTRQVLGPGESKEMAVRFVIDPDMPASIEMLTLSYTFFPAPEPVTATPADALETPNS